MASEDELDAFPGFEEEESEDSPEEEEEPVLEAVAPSGAKITVLTEEERKHFEGRGVLYMDQNRFTNVSDLQDIDRLVGMELLSWRWTMWIAQEADYWGNPVELDKLYKQSMELSKEIRLLKKALGMDKAARDKSKGEKIDDYLKQLQRRAKEFGIYRENQAVEAITIFKDMVGRFTLYKNSDEKERRMFGVQADEVMEWLEEEAIPRMEEIEEDFIEKQKYWGKL